jgi:hypothetical protein
LVLPFLTAKKLKYFAFFNRKGRKERKGSLNQRKEQEY